jgi:malate dehydrogenase (quinone)
LTLSDDHRIDALREFAPSATSSDWETIVAGQRVQVIRPEKDKGGGLGFDTTAVISADGSIAGLLGASPGASTSVHDVLDVMERAFGRRYESWLPRLKEMVPSLGVKLSDEPRLFYELWDWTTRVLGLS